MATKKQLNQSVYAVFFFHGQKGEREVESTEVFLNEIENITEIGHIKAIEQSLSQQYVFPKVINYVFLRKKK